MPFRRRNQRDSTGAMITPDEAAAHGWIKDPQYNYSNLEIARRKSKELHMGGVTHAVVRNRDGSYDLWRVITT